MNFVIEKYDTTLKETLAQQRKAERMVRLKDAALLRKSKKFKTVAEKAVEEQDRVLAQKTAPKARFLEKSGELKGKYKSSREKVKELEREKAILEEKKAALERDKTAASLRHLKKINRLRVSRPQS